MGFIVTLCLVENDLGQNIKHVNRLNLSLNGTKYSRMDQVKFVEDSLLKISALEILN